jgi:hypothetical protein
MCAAQTKRNPYVIGHIDRRFGRGSLRPNLELWLGKTCSMQHETKEISARQTADPRTANVVPGLHTGASKELWMIMRQAVVDESVAATGQRADPRPATTAGKRSDRRADTRASSHDGDRSFSGTRFDVGPGCVGPGGVGVPNGRTRGGRCVVVHRLEAGRLTRVHGRSAAVVDRRLRRELL